MSEAHVRIDEGIKRGPRKRAAPPQAEPIVEKPKRTGKLSEVKIEEVLQRYLADETTAEIAASLNVNRSALHQWLLRTAEEPWKQAQVARAITALEEAKEQLRGAQDALSLARAREQLRGAQWELERVFSRVYGQKQEVAVTMDIHVQVDHALTAEAGELLGRIRSAGMRQVASQQEPIIDVVNPQQIIEK